MRQLTDRDGQPLVLHRPTGPERGVRPGITIHGPEDDSMATKADRSGIYTLNGARFKIRQGDPIPEGAVIDDGQARSLTTAPAAEGTVVPEGGPVLVDPATLRQAIAEGRVSITEIEDVLAEYRQHDPASSDQDTGADTHSEPDAGTAEEGRKEAVTEGRTQGPAPETKAKPAAPENKAKGGAPENRSKPAPKKSGE